MSLGEDGGGSEQGGGGGHGTHAMLVRVVARLTCTIAIMIACSNGLNISAALYS